MFYRQHERLYESGIPLRNFSDDMPFREYIAANQAMIAKGRLDLHEDDANIQKIIKANSPQEFIPPQQGLIENGILLVHGLWESPHNMQSQFDFFAKKNFMVRSLLLPGHGTRPGDLLNINLEDWQDALSYAIKGFNGQVKNLFIAGYSTGASLALQSAYQGTKIKGLILFAPALGIKNKFSHISHWPPFLSFLSHRFNWFRVARDKDYSKYHSMCFNSIRQIHRLTQQLKSEIKNPVSVPLFVTLSADDEIVNGKTTLDFFNLQNEATNRMFIFSNEIIIRDNQQISYHPSAYPADNILDLSHMCLSISPEHPHYGRHGDYQNMLYKTPKWPWQKEKALRLGALTPNNLARYQIRRLTYNPHFDTMMKHIDTWISLNI